MKKIELLFICKDEPHYPFEGLEKFKERKGMDNKEFKNYVINIIDKFLTVKKVKVEPVWKGGDKFISITCDVEDYSKHENKENPIVEIRSNLEVEPFSVIMK